MAFDLDDEELKATRRMNGSDKNVACMEEDIKILESECYYLEELGYLRENNHFIRFNQALKNLIKAYKELEENNTYLKTHILTPTTVKLNYIPKTLVEEKIEELNKAYEDSKDENGESEYYYPDYTIRVLEELLEKRK